MGPMGHALRVGLGVGGRVRLRFVKYGHVAYQIEWLEEYNS